MEIQSNSIRATQKSLNQIQYDTQNNKTSSSFISNLHNTDNTDNKKKEIDISFQNINTMSLDEIEESYQDKDQTNLLTALKLSTLFSTNMNMNEALFNTVLGQNDVSSAQVYLSSMMSNRNTYLSNSNDGGAWLRQNLISQLDGEVQAEQIKLEKEFLFLVFSQ